MSKTEQNKKEQGKKVTEIKVTGLTKINFDGQEGLTVKEYCEAKAVKVNLRKDQSPIVSMAIRLTQGKELPPGADPKVVAAAQKLQASVCRDIEKSHEERQAKKAADESRKLEEEAAARKRKEEAEVLMSKSMAKLAPAADKLAIAAMAAIGDKKHLGSGFMLVDGKLTLAKENPSAEEFAQAFAVLESYQNGIDKVSRNIVLLEAQLARIAKRTYGDEWPNFFSAVPGRISILKKNVKCLEQMEELGLPSETSAGEIGPGVARALLEAKFSTDESTNKEIKEAVFSEYVEKSNDRGSNLTAAEAREIVVAKKKSLGKQGKQQYKYLYIFANAKTGKFIAVGSNELTPVWVAKSVAVIDRALNIHSSVDGVIESKAIESPTESDLKFMQSLGIEAPKAETKDETQIDPPAKKKVGVSKTAPPKEESKEPEEDNDADINSLLSSDDDSVDPSDGTDNDIDDPIDISLD